MLLFQEVVFSGNQLATLHGMEHLKMVRTLVLDGNQLESLPEEMGSLSELRILSLKNNSIFMFILLVACPRQELLVACPRQELLVKGKAGALGCMSQAGALGKGQGRSSWLHVPGRSSW